MLKITKKKTEPKAMVSTELKHKNKVTSEEHHEEAASIDAGSKNIVEGALCQVGFEASFTKNLGDYNSAKIGVSIVIPCMHSEIGAVYDVASKWVNDRLEKAISEMDEEG